MPREATAGAVEAAGGASKSGRRRSARDRRTAGPLRHVSVSRLAPPRPRPAPSCQSPPQGGLWSFQLSSGKVRNVLWFGIFSGPQAFIFPAPRVSTLPLPTESADAKAGCGQTVPPYASRGRGRYADGQGSFWASDLT